MFNFLKNKSEREVLKMNEEAYSLLYLTGLAPSPDDQSMQAEYALSISNAYHDGGNVYDAACYYLIKLKERDLVNSEGESINDKVEKVFSTFVDEAKFSDDLESRFKC